MPNVVTLKYWDGERVMFFQIEGSFKVGHVKAVRAFQQTGAIWLQVTGHDLKNLTQMDSSARSKFSSLPAVTLEEVKK